MSVSVASMSFGIANQAVAPKSPRAETPSAQELATPSTIVAISAESSGDEDAKAVEDSFAEKPGATLQMLSGQAQGDNYDKEFHAYFYQPRETANNSLRRASAELVRLQDRIEDNRSSMLGKKWDFVLKDDKIEVINDNLNAKDRQWLENTLNKNQRLVSSVQSFYGAVTKYYDNTKDHGLPSVRDSAGIQTGYVIGAADQINGKLAIRDIMDQSMASLSRPKYPLSSDTTKPFLNSIELSASYFKVEAQPKYQVMRYDLSDPKTAQYFKDHPEKLYP